VEHYSSAGATPALPTDRRLRFIEFDAKLACPAIFGEDAILIECNTNPVGEDEPDGGPPSPVVFYGAVHAREGYAHGVLGRVSTEMSIASFSKLAEFRMTEVPGTALPGIEQRSWRNGATERFRRWAELCKDYRTFPDQFQIAACAWIEKYTMQQAFTIEPINVERKGCARDGGTTLIASAYMPTPSVIRFFVRRNDGRPWTSGTKVSLFVGDGPTCAARPPNVVKQTSDVVPGNVIQTINLNVDPYEGEWSAHEEKTFWIGVQENGWTSFRASATVTIVRNDVK
jgi:hypothetical protein